MDGRHLSNEEKLNEIYQMVHENHQILRSLHRQQYLANIGRVIYWLAILGILGGAYYYVKPLIDSFSSHGANVDQTITQINQLTGQLPETKLLTQVLEWLKKSAESQ
jgi:hypothetical protein